MVINVDSENGFSLMELVIVIAVILIVMQVVFVSFSFFQEDKSEKTLAYLNQTANETLISYYGMFGNFNLNRAFSAGNTYRDVAKVNAEQIILTLQRETGINLGKDYDYNAYKMNIAYVNEYVMKIDFEMR